MLLNILGLIIGIPLAIAFPACAVGVMQGHAAGKAFRSIARRPAASGSIRTLLLVSMAFMETLAIYGLLISMMIITRL